MKALANAEKEKKVKAQASDTAKETTTNTLQLVALDQESAIIKSDNISHFPQTTKGYPLIVSQRSAEPTHLNHQQRQAAANMFSAAQLPVSRFTQVLWVLALLGGILAISLSLQIFQTKTSSTQLLIAQNPLSKNQTPRNPLPSSNQIIQPPAQTAPKATTTSDQLQNMPSPSAGISQIYLFDKVSGAQNSTPTTQSASVSQAKPSEPLLIDSATTNVGKQTSPSPQNALQLSLKKAIPVVDPALLSAYQAFNQGDLSQAQQLYRQVLQKEFRNVDALLGMAAIAQRQSRIADASGWYQKVLEIEPSHPLAQAAMVEMHPTIDSVGQISRLKSLIAQQPGTASLYAALGNAHAEQSHWQEAQAAYFEAVRFAPQSVENIFNLAISLEHLNQPQLALLQYQRALQLIEQSGATTLDSQMIKNRILALQQSS